MTAVIDRDRLARLLGMLGSAHDGEIVNAGRAASRLVRKAGTTWPEILRPDEVAVEAARQLLAENQELRDQIWQLRQQVRPRPPQPLAHSKDPAEAVEGLLLWRDNLTDWEEGSLESLLRRSRPYTDKQREVLISIGLKVDRLVRSTWETSA